MESKRCTKCGETRPLSMYGPDGAARLRAQCRPCVNAASKEYATRNSVARARTRRARHYRNRFGMTLAEVDSLFEHAGRACEACAIPMSETFNGTLAIDHDHACCPGKDTCGKCIRGVLCTKCNAALGALGDDPKLVERLLHYISSRSA